MYLRITALLLLASVLFTACVKKSKKLCEDIAQVKITSKGDTAENGIARLSVPDFGMNTFYQWYGPNNLNAMSNEIDLSPLGTKHRGWYYVTVNNSENQCIGRDSFYLNVKIAQGNPPCTRPNNTATFTGLFDDNFQSVTNAVHPTFGLRCLYATNTMISECKVFFHRAFTNKEPEDGIYTTANTVHSVNDIENNINTVYIDLIKQSFYYGSAPRQKVYVSHVNGKLQVRFCNLQFGGNAVITGSGNLVQR